MLIVDAQVHLWIAALALVLGFAAVDDGYAQEYPAKPIRLIIALMVNDGAPMSSV